MTSAYKVWAGDNGYLILSADTCIAAKLDYWTNFGSAAEMFEAGADIHCHLVERNVELSAPDAEFDCRELRQADYIFAGIIHPEWAEKRMVDGWWYHEKGEEETGW